MYLRLGYGKEHHLLADFVAHELQDCRSACISLFLIVIVDALMSTRST